MKRNELSIVIIPGCQCLCIEVNILHQSIVMVYSYIIESDIELTGETNPNMMYTW